MRGFPRTLMDRRSTSTSENRQDRAYFVAGVGGTLPATRSVMRFASLLALVASMTLAATAGATPPNAPVATTPHATVVRPVAPPVRPPEVHAIQVMTTAPAEIRLTTAPSSVSAHVATRQPPRTPAPTVPSPQLYNGVRSLLGSLKERNITFGVASNNKRAYVVGLVDKLGLGDLLPTDHVVASDWGEDVPEQALAEDSPGPRREAGNGSEDDDLLRRQARRRARRPRRGHDWRRHHPRRSCSRKGIP